MTPSSSPSADNPAIRWAKKELKRAAPKPEPVMVHIGRKVPKGFEELPGSVHLGKGIWAFRVRQISPLSK